MSVIQKIGEKTVNLLDLSNYVNNIIFTSFGKILSDLSDNIDLKKRLKLHERENLIELSHKINIIKNVDNNSKILLNDLDNMLDIDPNLKNKSLLLDLQDVITELLDITTGLNRFILDATSDLFNSVSTSTNLKNLLETKDFYELNNILDNIKIIKNIDNKANELLEKVV